MASFPFRPPARGCGWLDGAARDPKSELPLFPSLRSMLAGCNCLSRTGMEGLIIPLSMSCRRFCIGKVPLPEIFIKKSPFKSPITPFLKGETLITTDLIRIRLRITVDLIFVISRYYLSVIYLHYKIRRQQRHLSTASGHINNEFRYCHT